ncbi:GSCOCG00002509001-RA-CDS [Cotesia congregata]|nr:GSCOCG00002509001-RA-CDS [Cotesia congregata]
MAKPTFSLLGIFLLITIATAAIIIEPIPDKNVTRRSVVIDSIKKLGGDALDVVDGTFDFLGRLFGVNSKRPVPVAVKNMDDLRKAILYHDDDEVTKILLRENFFNSEIVAARYRQRFWSDIKNDIKASFTGAYRDLLVAFVEDKYEFLAKELHDGIFGISGGNIYAGLDVLCNPKADQIAQIIRAYRLKYGRKLTSDLAYVPDLNIRASIMRFAQGQKLSQYAYNPAMVEFSGYDRNDAYYNELLCTRDGPRFFSDRLHSSLIYGDYRGLTRLMITLINHDGYESVMNAYQKKYGQSLMDTINLHTTGAYNYALWVIIDMAANHNLVYTDDIPSIIVRN